MHDRAQVIIHFYTYMFNLSDRRRKREYLSRKDKTLTLLFFK